MQKIFPQRHLHAEDKAVKQDTMHNVHRTNIIETRHDAQMCMCIMSCFNDIFCDAHFCIMLCHSRVSHPSLQCAGAFVASSTLSQTIKHHVFFIRFLLKNDQPTVYRHTHTSLVNHAMNTIYLTSMHECSKQYGCMIAWFPNMFVAYDFFKLFFRFSTCISKLYFSTLNVFR